MQKESKVDHIKKDCLYFMPSGNVVRVVRIDYKKNVLILRNYHSYSNESIDFDTGCAVMERAYNITEVSRMVKRKSTTIRKYESMGLLVQPKKISIKPSGSRPYRVYSQREVDDMVNFFEKRRSAGRPTVKKHDTISKSDIKQKLDSLQKEKLNG